MAKRGRKPKERKGYFYEVEENAINQYIHESNEAVKNQSYADINYLFPMKSLTKILMIPYHICSRKSIISVL